MPLLENYLDRLTDTQRSALARIQKIAQTVVPEAEPMLSYGMPGLRYKKRPLIWFAAFKNHCSLFPTGSVITTLQAELTDYECSKGTIRFTPDHPITAALIRKIVRQRQRSIDRVATGGNLPAHHRLALWAARCAARVLPIFEQERPRDLRPRQAIAAARAWARGKITVGQARTAALDAHRAARAATDPAAQAAAQAAGHAAATAHVATHASGAANYAIKAISIKSGPDAVAKEVTWQQRPS